MTPHQTPINKETIMSKKKRTDCKLKRIEDEDASNYRLVKILTIVIVVSMIVLLADAVVRTYKNLSTPDTIPQTTADVCISVELADTTLPETVAYKKKCFDILYIQLNQNAPCVAITAVGTDDLSKMTDILATEGYRMVTEPYMDSIVLDNKIQYVFSVTWVRKGHK